MIYLTYIHTNKNVIYRTNLLQNITKKQESKQKSTWSCILRTSIFSATPQTAVRNKRSK